MQGDFWYHVQAALRTGGGYYVWKDESGQEFVISRREDFEKQQESPLSEKQLPLPTTASLAQAVSQAAHQLDTTPGDVLEQINHEIASWRVEEQEREIDDLGLPAPRAASRKRIFISRPATPAGGLKVRFEPIRGDLPPELQE